MRTRKLLAAVAVAMAASAGGLAAGTAVASPVPATSVVQEHQAHKANPNWFFDGAVHPYGNPHWCFFGSLSSKTALQTNTPVVLEKCKTTSKKLPEAGEYWHGYRVYTVGQMFLLAKPNYVLGRYKRRPPAVFVPFEHVKDANNFIGFTQDKHGHWRIDLVDQVNKRPYFLIMPEHLKASATYYPMKWIANNVAVPSGWTDNVILPPWEQVQTT